MNCIQLPLNPACSYLLVCRNGKQISKLTNIFGRFAYEAIEKCIVPACYRQIIDTESTEKLDTLRKQIYRKISNILQQLLKYIIRNVD